MVGGAGGRGLGGWGGGGCRKRDGLCALGGRIWCTCGVPWNCGGRSKRKGDQNRVQGGCRVGGRHGGRRAGDTPLPFARPQTREAVAVVGRDIGSARTCCTGLDLPTRSSPGYSGFPAYTAVALLGLTFCYWYTGAEPVWLWQCDLFGVNNLLICSITLQLLVLRCWVADARKPVCCVEGFLNDCLPSIPCSTGSPQAGKRHIKYTIQHNTYSTVRYGNQ